MTSTTFEGINISSQFIGIDKRLSKDDYKNDYYILYPKYAITINNKTFEYSQSANFLKEAMHKNFERGKSSVFYEMSYIKPNSGAIETGIYIDIAHNKRDLFNSNKSLISNDIKSIRDLHIMFSAKKESELSDKDMLFALRAILEDALVGFQFYTPGEFGKEFGYEDIDKCIEVFNACNQTRVKLRLSETKIHELIEKLSEQGIE